MMEVKEIRISTGTIIKAAWLLGLFYILYLLRDTVVMLFGAVIVASAIEPLANWAARYRIPRSLTVIAVYAVLLLLLLGITAILVQPLAGQVSALAQEVPRLVNRLSEYSGWLPHYDQAQMVSVLQSSLTRFGDNITGISANVFRSTRTFISGIVNLLFMFVIALYLVTERDALVKLARLVTPKAYESYAVRAVGRAQQGLGKWVLAQIVLGVVVGAMVGIGLWALGVEYALLLALLSGVMELVPIIGPVISTVPALLVALNQSWVMLLAVWGFYLIVGQIEGNFLVPHIMKKTVGLKPLVTMVAVLVGAKLMGFLGILLAVPVANVIRIFLLELMTEKVEEAES